VKDDDREHADSMPTHPDWTHGVDVTRLRRAAFDDDGRPGLEPPMFPPGTDPGGHRPEV
jgi:hypothetical protein